MNCVDAFLDEEADQEKACSTVDHYRMVIKMFTDFFQDGEIAKKDIREFKNVLLDIYLPKTVNNYIVICNKFIKFVEFINKYGEFELFAFKKFTSTLTMKPVKIQKEIYLDEVLEPSDLKRLLRKAKEKKMMDLYFIMKIYAYTGIRESELKYFTVENLENNVLMISNKGKVRKVIVRNDLMRELRRYAKKNKIESGTLFPGKNGKMLHRTTITRRMKKLAGQCRGINLNKIHPHSFRHLFAIQFLKCGGTLNELQAQLGHSSLNTTSIYTATTVMQRKNSINDVTFG